jgi:hypothetical protein
VFENFSFTLRDVPKVKMFITQYCLVDKIEKNEMGWYVKHMVGSRGVYRYWVGKPEGK